MYGKQTHRLTKSDLKQDFHQLWEDWDQIHFDKPKEIRKTSDGALLIFASPFGGVVLRFVKGEYQKIVNQFNTIANSSGIVLQ